MYVSSHRILCPYTGFTSCKFKLKIGLTSRSPPLVQNSLICIFWWTNNVIWGLSLFSRVWLFATPWTAACQTPLSTVFSRQEYWSGLPCPSPGDLPNLGVEAGIVSCIAGVLCCLEFLCRNRFLHCRNFFTAEPLWKP